MVSLDGKERERAFQPLLEFLFFMFMVFLEALRQQNIQNETVAYLNNLTSGTILDYGYGNSGCGRCYTGLF